MWMGGLRASVLQASRSLNAGAPAHIPERGTGKGDVPVMAHGEDAHDPPPAGGADRKAAGEAFPRGFGPGCVQAPRRALSGPCETPPIRRGSCGGRAHGRPSRRPVSGSATSCPPFGTAVRVVERHRICPFGPCQRLENTRTDFGSATKLPFSSRAVSGTDTARGATMRDEVAVGQSERSAEMTALLMVSRD
ncbi:hypothetical protein SAMN05443573_1063 [Celeribacter indicus]|nr:hypothetical protein SAMN05443573_1063 [Celeribacter indicus]